MQHLLLKWEPFWKKSSDWYIIFILFGFSDPENINIDTNIKFLSPLFAEIYDIENSCQLFWKWLPQPPQTNIIAIFGFCDPENKDIDTIINFLSILFAEIWDIENSCQPFWKWLPQPPQTNIIAIFGFLHPDNMDIETIIILLYYSPRYGTLTIHVSHFENGCHSSHRPNLVGVPSWYKLLLVILIVCKMSCLYHKMHGLAQNGA